MSRAKMSPAERELRSQLAKLTHVAPLVRGTISVRMTTCGNPRCRCAKGQKHRAVYLLHHKAGKLHQMFIPRRLEAQVRDWVTNYHRVKELLEEVSERAHAALSEQKGGAPFFVD